MQPLLSGQPVLACRINRRYFFAFFRASAKRKSRARGGAHESRPPRAYLRLPAKRKKKKKCLFCRLTVLKPVKMVTWPFPEGDCLIQEGLSEGVVHSVNRHILFLRNRKPLSFSSKNRHRPKGRTIILITDLLKARSKFFAIC